MEQMLEFSGRTDCIVIVLSAGFAVNSNEYSPIPPFFAKVFKARQGFSFAHRHGVPSRSFCDRLGEDFIDGRVNDHRGFRPAAARSYKQQWHERQKTDACLVHVQSFFMGRESGVFTDSYCLLLRINGLCWWRTSAPRHRLLRVAFFGSSGFTVGKKVSNISYERRFRQGNHRVSGVSEGYKSRPPKRMLPIAKSVGVFFAVWIFEFRPSLTALVMRCSKYVSNQRRLMGSSRWDDRGHSEFYYRHRSRSSARIGGWT